MDFFQDSFVFSDRGLRNGPRVVVGRVSRQFWDHADGGHLGGEATVLGEFGKHVEPVGHVLGFEIGNHDFFHIGVVVSSAGSTSHTVLVLNHSWDFH